MIFKNVNPKKLMNELITGGILFKEAKVLEPNQIQIILPENTDMAIFYAIIKAHNTEPPLIEETLEDYLLGLEFRLILLELMAI